MHGPFPLRLLQLVAAVAVLGLGLLLLMFGMRTEILSCSAAAVGAECRLSAGYFEPGMRMRVQRSRVLGVRVDTEVGSKNTTLGIPVLELGGREQRLMRVEPAKARWFAERVNGHLSRGEAFELELQGPRWMLAVGLLAALGAAGIAFSALRGIGRYVLEPGSGWLAIRRRLLGIPLGVQQVSLDGVRDVTVEWGTERDFWARRGSAGRPTGRITFVTDQGPRPLTAGFHPGKTVHLRAACQLRALLGFEPRAGGVEAELAAVLENPVTPALGQGAGGRVVATWIGVCCGSLAGLLIFALVGIAFGLLRPSDQIEGWMLAVGCGGGALAGVVLALRLTRPRVPR